MEKKTVRLVDYSAVLYCILFFYLTFSLYRTCTYIYLKILALYIGDGLHKHKSIGMWGSVSIAVNSLAGPALLQLPFTYQQAGIIPTTFALIFVAILSSFCCMHTADVVSKVPGNKDFCKPIEFSDPYRIFWSHKAYLVTQILFYCCTICVNIAATVDTAQIVDSFLGHWKGTWGFAVDDWEFQEWIHNHACSRKKVKLGRCLPFASANYGQILLSLGYIITAAVFMPLCLMDLKVRLRCVDSLNA
jgi:hypothetical protein